MRTNSHRMLALLAVVAVSIAGCSSSGDKAATTTSTASPETAETTSPTVTAAPPPPTVAMTKDVTTTALAATIGNNTDALKDAFKGLGLVTAVDDFSYDQGANVINVSLQTKYGTPTDPGVADFQRQYEDDLAWDSIFSATDGFPFWSDDFINGGDHQPLPIEWLPALHVTLDGTFSYRCAPQTLIDFQNKDAGRVQFDQLCVGK